MTSTADPQTTGRVIVVGGGTAGAHATSALAKSGLEVTIVEPTGAHQFLTRLAAVAGGTQAIGDSAAPLDAMFDAKVVRSRAVVASDRSVQLTDGELLHADAVVLTAGAEPADAPIDGLEKVMSLRSASDSLVIRSKLETAAAIAIVGGGPTGCQLAGAIAASHPDLAVTLVDSGDHLMGAFGEQLGEHTHSILTERGVSVKLEDSAEKMSARQVTLSDGSTLEATVVWAGGYESTMEHFGPTTDGRLNIDSLGRVSGHSTLFAAGDNAAHLDGDGDLYPMSAQIAAQAGRQVARNVAAVLAERSPTPLDLKDRGWVVDLGGGVGVADLLGVAVARSPLDRLVPLLHTAIDIRNLWQLGGVDFVRRFRPGASEGDALGIDFGASSRS